MKSKIKQITLLDGKQLFYPSEEELQKVWSQVESIIYEELMTKEEYLERYVIMPALSEGLLITKVELREYYSKNDDG